MASFPSVRIEGGLFGSDLLEQLVSGDLPGQGLSDFDLDGGHSLTSEFAAAFADVRVYWSALNRRLERLGEDDSAITVTRDVWIIPLLGLLGYELQLNHQAHKVDGLTFAISHQTGETDESLPVHIVGARQELGRVPPSGRPRLAPHSLVQEYLNRTDLVWGIVTNGLRLRLLRNSNSARQQAFVEFDLRKMLDEQRFTDFTALYRLLHRTRLQREKDGVNECLLDHYHAHSREQGDRVRDRLREGVEECIRRLANGFLRHPDNGELRRRVAVDAPEKERIGAEELYRQLLRLVYRLLFLLVSEDRGLLSSDDVYREYYGISRLRRLLDQRAAFTDHDDLWQSLRVLWCVLSDEKLAEILRLAPLNGELYVFQELDRSTLSNCDLLEAFWFLAWYRDGTTPPRRINYAALDVEELGSIYESLLDFHPVIVSDAVRPNFHLSEGSERKTTGSYYTPPQLVSELIKSALDPVIENRLATAPPDQRERALLSIRVCDPASGSGHFLLSAARSIGKALAQERTGDAEPTPEHLREAIRDVISHCIYGVDKNPLAVDLCRVALWLESHTGDKPLTFLDHRIRCGDSLVGIFDLDVLKEGIPDEALKPLEGDDKTTARTLMRRNRDEREGQENLFPRKISTTLADFTRTSQRINRIDDDTPKAIRRKKQLFEQNHTDPAWLRQREACDLWMASFFQPLQPDTPTITSGTLMDHSAGHANSHSLALARDLSLQFRFFHWPMEFPEVFVDGGFDVILSNPPWEKVKLQEKEFFSVRDAGVANARNKAERAKMIQSLTKTDPSLYAAFIVALRTASGTSAFLRHGGRFPLTGRGDINTYAVFAELARNLIRQGGRCGIILPSGIATDDTTKLFFQNLIRLDQLVSLYDFENRKKLFPAIHRGVKFCLCTLCVPLHDNELSLSKDVATFTFFAHEVEDIRQPQKRFTLTYEDIALLNPNTHNCPIFRTQSDAELTKAIYRRVPVLVREAFNEVPEYNPWKVRLSSMFHMSNDSYHFRTADELRTDGYQCESNTYMSSYDRYLPLYEAKMLHQFDHRWATYGNTGTARATTSNEKRDPLFVVQPRYWIREELVESILLRYSSFEHAAQSESSVKAIGDIFETPDNSTRELSETPDPNWLLGWRMITGSTNKRTLIIGMLPRVAVGHSLSLIFSMTPPIYRMNLGAILNSLVVDYCARQKVGGTSLSYFMIRQLPIMPPEIFGASPCWLDSTLMSNWFFSRLIELVYTARDLTPLARDCGYDGPPFPWDERRRFEIRCELDAAIFHLYLPGEADGSWRLAENETSSQLSMLKRHFAVPRDAVAYILNQFDLPGCARDRILEIYDAIMVAQRIKRPYRSRLDPLPGTKVLS